MTRYSTDMGLNAMKTITIDLEFQVKVKGQGHSDWIVPLKQEIIKTWDKMRWKLWHLALKKVKVKGQGQRSRSKVKVIQTLFRMFLTCFTCIPNYFLSSGLNAFVCTLPLVLVRPEQKSISMHLGQLEFYGISKAKINIYAFNLPSFISQFIYFMSIIHLRSKLFRFVIWYVFHCDC